MARGRVVGAAAGFAVEVSSASGTIAKSRVRNSARRQFRRRLWCPSRSSRARRSHRAVDRSLPNSSPPARAASRSTKALHLGGNRRRVALPKRARSPSAPTRGAAWQPVGGASACVDRALLSRMRSKRWPIAPEIFRSSSSASKKASMCESVAGRPMSAGVARCQRAESLDPFVDPRQRSARAVQAGEGEIAAAAVVHREQREAHLAAGEAFRQQIAQRVKIAERL